MPGSPRIIRLAADRQATARDLNVELVDLMTLLTHADYVSRHLPLTAETHHIINTAALR